MNGGASEQPHPALGGGRTRAKVQPSRTSKHKLVMSLTRLKTVLSVLKSCVCCVRSRLYRLARPQPVTGPPDQGLCPRDLCPGAWGQGEPGTQENKADVALPRE